MVHVDTKPYWMRTGPLPAFGPLDRNITVDVAVVGGGLVGITTAYLLKASGLSVALIERDRCASVDTGHTTAHLTMVTDVPLTDLVRQFDRDTAMAVWDGGRTAIDQIDRLVQTERIDCEFRRRSGFLLPAFTGRGLTAEQLRAQVDLACDLEFAATFVDSVPPFGLPGARFDHQALFHPRKYLSALVRTIPGDGSHVFEQTAVDSVSDDSLAVKAGRHTVSCAYVVLATHTPRMGRASMAATSLLQSKLALYSTYALGGRIPSRLVPSGLYWDTADPYHYLRVEPKDGFDYAIFGGADHKTGQVSETDARWEELATTVRRLLPTFELTDRWSGQVVESLDGLPFIGETADGQFVATGFGGNGMTFGTLAALMARDAVFERPNPWREVFDPGRTSVRAGGWDYLKENADYAYYMLRDHLVARHATTLRVLKPGQGRVLDLNGQRVAAYRDPHGVVSLCSAICTHMGCEVQFNQGERTWDCPCHGSRFRVDGAVVSGPAESPLPEIE